MKEYHKIQSVYKRDEKTHKFIEGSYSLPEFEYLKDNIWVWDEKIDGTNIRIDWDGQGFKIGGRTDNAQIPTFLYTKLIELFNADNFSFYADKPMCLYGEGYGARIQKGGGLYISNGVSFILFDVRIRDYWLKQEDVLDIANNLRIDVAPVVGEGTLQEAENLVRSGLTSTFGQFFAEGLVLRPKVEMFNRNGHRIITKMKGKDW